MSIRELREAVEAGRDDSEKWRPAFGDQAFDGMAAFHGSIDAAKRLHDALLPGWDLLIHTYEPDDFSVSVSEPLKVETYDGVSGLIARAWLIAILRALEQEGRE